MPRKGPGLKSVADQIRSDVDLALEAGAQALQAQIVSELSTPGRGRVYRKYGPKRLHQASLAGDPPAPDTGALRNSIEITRTETGFRVGTNIEYADALEFGTARIAPRPYMRPALEKVRDQLGPLIVARIVRGRGSP